MIYVQTRSGTVVFPVKFLHPHYYIQPSCRLSLEISKIGALCVFGCIFVQVVSVCFFVSKLKAIAG